MSQTSGRPMSLKSPALWLWFPSSNAVQATLSIYHNGFWFWIKQNETCSAVWWDGPVIAGLWPRGLGDWCKRTDSLEFEASWVYTANSRAGSERPCVKQGNNPTLSITNSASMGKIQKSFWKDSVPQVFPSAATLRRGPSSMEILGPGWHKSAWEYMLI